MNIDKYQDFIKISVIKQVLVFKMKLTLTEKLIVVKKIIREKGKKKKPDSDESGLTTFNY